MSIAAPSAPFLLDGAIVLVLACTFALNIVLLNRKQVSATTTSISLSASYPAVQAALQQLNKAAQTQQARTWLNRLEHNPNPVVLGYVKQNLKAAGLTLEDIGTTPARLHRLTCKIWLKDLTFCLEQLAQNPHNTTFIAKMEKTLGLLHQTPPNEVEQQQQLHHLKQQLIKLAQAA